MLLSGRAMNGFFSDVTGAITGAVKSAGGVVVKAAVLPYQLSAKLSLGIAQTALSTAAPILGQAGNVASTAIRDVGGVAAQVGGSAAGAAEGILTSAGQAVSAAKGNTIAPPPPSNMPLIIGGVAAAAILGLVLLRRPRDAS